MSDTTGATTDGELLPVTRRYLAGSVVLTLAVVAIVGAVMPAYAPHSLISFVVSSLAMLAVLLAALVLAHRWVTRAIFGNNAIAPSMSNALGGLQAPFTDRDSETAAALRLAQVRHVFEQLGAMMTFNIINAFIVAFALAGSVNAYLLGGWLLLVQGTAIMALAARFTARKRPPPKSASKRTLRRITLHAGLRGVLWGLCFALFFPAADSGTQIILIVVSLGMFAGGVSALSPLPSASLAYGLGIMFPTVLGLVAVGNLSSIVVLMFSLTFSASMVTVGSQLYHLFATNFLARRAQAEQAATISLLLNEFENSASDWLWETDKDDRVVRMPPRMHHILGIEQEAGLSLRLTDILARAETGMQAELQQALANRDPFRDVSFQMISGSGQPHWISLTASPKPTGGYRGVGSDITARILAEQDAAGSLRRAEQAEQRLKDGIDAVGAGFVLSDCRERTVIANRQFTAMFPAHALTGQEATFETTMRAQDQLWQAGATEGTRGWLDAMLTRDAVETPMRDVRLPTGRWLRVEQRPTTEGGSVRVLTDITDIKLQEAELASQAKRLEASNQELQQFATIASHDLQEPLRKIEAFGARLKSRSGSLDADGQMFLERMMASSLRMRRLITDLLSYSRAARRDSAFQEVDLDRVLSEVLEDLSLRLEECKATIDIGKLHSIQGNTTQLQQLFLNLLSNALKFSKPNIAPRITIERRSGTDGACEIRVTDNGIGFDMKHHDQIFEIFQRLHGREAYEGTGIGLATCRKIVERHNGTIRAESVPGVGTTFIIALPANAAVARHVAAA